MYASLKPWINVPFKLKPFVKRNGAGTKVFDADVSALCYPVSDVVNVVNKDGAEVTSSTQLYVEGTLAVAPMDEVIFENEQRPIQRINSFYRDGAVDLKVVYL